MENSTDELARLVPGACVTDSNGLYDKMQHTVITPKSKERRIDVECLDWKEGSETSSAKFFWVHSGAQPGNNLTKDTETEPFASFFEEWTTVEIDLRRLVYAFEETWT